MSRKTLLSIGIAVAALASIAVFAQQRGPSRDDIIEAVSPDLPTGARQQQRIQSQKAIAASRASAPKIAARAPAAPTIDDVYDVDSFKRSVTYLGLASAFINLSDTCPVDPANPDELCQVLAPAPAFTNFNFQDAARIKLPAKASNSILCYWFSPVLNIGYGNFGTTPAYGRLRYNPTLTIENPVLDDPALIDPTTGAPFGGKLLTSMSSSESFVVPLDPGVSFSERTRDSTVCMAGFVSKKALIDNYGLTEAQATKFFNKPTTVRLNVTGAAQNVTFASMVFGLRVMGDER
ncbi:hypothetical protein [Lysobacter brunescens]|uniref:Uncharacterized protein n=1 Tax=Lysobacter brunescens TaxID=262323 RepID=A0ABW2Y712_9GAMM